MYKRLGSPLLVLLLVLSFLLVEELDAYEPLVTIGKPGLRDIVYSPDGQFLATLTTAYVELLDGETLEPVLQIAVEDGRDIALSPDSSLLAISTDEDVQVWHLPSESLLASFPITKKRTTRNGRRRTASVS